MNPRTRFLITAAFLCHSLLAPTLVTSQLLWGMPDAPLQEPASATRASNTPCAKQARSSESDETVICAIRQEKDGPIYKLQQDVEIHYRTSVLHADEVTYNSDTGEVTANGHFTLDGGPNDDHIKASHATYNLTTETGR